MLKLIDALEESDDVQKVFGNYEFSEKVFSKLPIGGWMPMHCVSNYPTIESNSKLGYITYLKQKWNIKYEFFLHFFAFKLILLSELNHVKNPIFVESNH